MTPHTRTRTIIPDPYTRGYMDAITDIYELESATRPIYDVNVHQLQAYVQLLLHTVCKNQGLEDIGVYVSDNYTPNVR